MTQAEIEKAQQELKDLQLTFEKQKIEHLLTEDRIKYLQTILNPSECVERKLGLSINDLIGNMLQIKVNDFGKRTLYIHKVTDIECIVDFKDYMIKVSFDNMVEYSKGQLSNVLDNRIFLNVDMIDHIEVFEDTVGIFEKLELLKNVL